MLIIGIAGTELAAHERVWLADAAVFGVILFGRNIVDRAQVSRLCAQIRDSTPRPLLIATDQEGGVVQRLRAGFTALPALAEFAKVYEQEPMAALALAREHAWLMASEVRAVGIDLSFAPVVDLGRGNQVIGSRAFAADPKLTAAFAQAYVSGMHEAGMAVTLKHYPGHGSVREDTHVEAAIDPRPLAEIRALDLLPFQAGIAAGAEAVMMAHVTYPAVAPEPAGYSPRWIGDILCGELGFRGVVISDDVSMAAAASAGDVGARVCAHLDAGCDLVLVCTPQWVPEALAAMRQRPTSNSARLPSLFGRQAHGWDDLLALPRYRAARDAMQRLPALH